MRSLDEIRHDNIDRSRRAAIAADRTPRIVCEKCDGAGHHKLSAPYANVFDALTSSWLPTEAVRESLHRRGDMVAATALINRLRYLVEYRLVETRLSPTSARRREWRVR